MGYNYIDCRSIAPYVASKESLEERQHHCLIGSQMNIFQHFIERLLLVFFIIERSIIQGYECPFLIVFIMFLKFEAST